MKTARSLLTGVAAIGAALAAQPAAASPALNLAGPSAMPLAAVGISQVACAPRAQLAAAVPVSKSAAILGQNMSALERMKAQQAGLAAPAPAPAMVAAPAAAISFSPACPPVLAAQPLRLPVLPAGQFLGSERVAISATRFDKQWNRATRRSLSGRDLARAIGDVPESRDALLGEVNRWVNHAIVYQSDGRRDRWADAKSTLKSRKGDCEDYAILKMQLLAAAGVRDEDMMLTLARDTLRRVDHAVLLVRQENDWVMLDIQSDRVASASLDYGYRPLMSFAAGRRYLHGQKVATTRLAYN